MLGVVATRLHRRSVTELFHAVAAAQPSRNKRRKASDEQLQAFVDDLHAHVPELAADRIDAAISATDRPSPAHLDTLRVLLDMKPRQIAEHPGPAVTLPVSDPAGITAWSTVLELSTHRPGGWTLVGGQMVHLLAWEHGEESPRVTTDADVVLDIRAYPKALLEVTERLLRTGYVEDGVSPEGLGHRYRNREVSAASIDVLLPEGLEDPAKYPTATGARTISVPGSVQALERSLKRSVVIGGTNGSVIRPDVHAAMVLKAAAHRAERGRTGAERHLRDLAVLVSLYARNYPESELRERLTKKDRERISDGLGALLPDNPIWRTVTDGREARDLVARAIKAQ
ncbi:hypothetical protein CQY20_33250 [Mycolicibacterium agri]|uniref:Uncharacterized protein n=1 Tax=Mycolicibacterium agri TaxID=36811 RepID=A0A2A7MN34_MYCAG|nr:hypothetical protein CQY20_33250 [Mycolicibacterium agri]